MIFSFREEVLTKFEILKVTTSKRKNIITNCVSAFVVKALVKLSDAIVPESELISSTISEVNFLYLFFNETLLKLFECTRSDELALEKTGKIKTIPIRIKHKYDIISFFFNFIKYC